MDINNLDNLTPINSINSRITYDLRYSEKTGKFTVSDAAMERLNLQDNGFNAFEDSEGNVVFMVVPNENAELFAGKSSSENKSNTFSANGLVSRLNVAGNTEWEMDEVEYQGNSYFSLNILSSEEPTEVVEEAVVEESPEYSI